MYNMKLWRLSQALSQYRSLPSMYSSGTGVCARRECENRGNLGRDTKEKGDESARQSIIA